MNDESRFDRIEKKLDNFDAKLDRLTEIVATQEKHSERLLILTERQHETASLAREAIAKADELDKQIRQNTVITDGIKMVAGIIVGVLVTYAVTKLVNIV